MDKRKDEAKQDVVKSGKLEKTRKTMKLRGSRG